MKKIILPIHIPALSWEPVTNKWNVSWLATAQGVHAFRRIGPISMTYTETNDTYNLKNFSNAMFLELADFTNVNELKATGDLGVTDVYVGLYKARDLTVNPNAIFFINKEVNNPTNRKVFSYTEAIDVSKNAPPTKEDLDKIFVLFKLRFDCYNGKTIRSPFPIPDLGIKKTNTFNGPLLMTTNPAVGSGLCWDFYRSTSYEFIVIAPRQLALGYPGSIHALYCEADIIDEIYDSNHQLVATTSGWTQLVEALNSPFDNVSAEGPVDLDELYVKI